MALLNYEKLQEYTSNFKTWISNKFVKKDYLVSGTQAEINSLISQNKIPVGAHVEITDDLSSGVDATEIAYNGTVSANNVGAAINQLNSDLNSIQQSVNTNTNNIAVQTSRIDTFVALENGSTTGDAELADIRVGYDGTTYPNAGDAVRGQVSELKGELVNYEGFKFDYNKSALNYGYKSFYHDDWELGYIYNGGNLDRTYAIRTKVAKAMPSYLIGKNEAPGVYKLEAYKYNQDGSYINYDAYNTSSFNAEFDQTKKYRLVIKFANGQDNIDLNTAINTILLFNPENVWDEFKKKSEYDSEIFSIENKIKDAKRDVNYSKQAFAYGYEERLSDDWEVGYIYNGGNLDRTYAIRTKEKKNYPKKVKIFNRYGNSIAICFYKYNLDGTYVDSSKSYKDSSFLYEFDEDYLYRITISLGDGTIDLNTVLDKVLFVDYSKQRIYERISVNVVYNYPKFYHTSSNITSVYFKNGTLLTFLNSKGDVLSKYTFREDVTYTLGTNDYLNFDLDNGTISIESKYRNDSQKITLLHFEYNVIFDCALKSYYDMWYSDSLKDGYLPYYYKNYIDEKVSSIRNKYRDVGANGDAFAFITDTHWNVNAKLSPSLLKHLCNNTMLNKVIHGGDIVPAYGTEDEMYSNAYNEFSSFNSKIGDKLYRLLGNHDIHITNNSTGDYYELTSSQTYGTLLANQENKVNYDSNNLDGGYFYFDNEIQKIRYICLNNFEIPPAYGITSTQLQWVKDRLLEVKDNYDVVVIGHSPLLPSQDSSATVFSSVLELLEQFANHTNDFVGCTSRLVGYICGHMHEDLYDNINNVNHISVLCDANYGRAYNTINEQAFDIFFIDKVNRKLYAIRIGSGSDREFTY